MGIEKPPPGRRCVFTRERNGSTVRCKKWALEGVSVCERHGAHLPSNKAKNDKAVVLRQMERFVAPISKDDPEAHPILAFEVEFRRTLGRIRWYDEQLKALEVEALTWGKTKAESIGASEFQGKNTTYEAKASLIHELQFRERQHLIAMEKIWLSARLDERKLDIQRAYVRALDVVLISILKGLGLDTEDPEVRQVVRDNLLALPSAGGPVDPGVSAKRAVAKVPRTR